MGFDIQTKDGIVLRNIPDGTPDDAIKARIAAIRGGQGPASEPAIPEAAPPGPTVRQRVQASMPGRVLQGMRDPIDAGAQMLPRALESVTSGFGIWSNPVSEYFGSEAKRVDEINKTNEAEYQAARQATAPRRVLGPGALGFDYGRLAGNIASPANVAVAARLPAAASTVGRIATGAAAGAAGGAMTPVNDVTEDQPYWTTKAAQMGVGAVTGGALGPVLGKVSDAITRRVQMFRANSDAVRSQAAAETDRIISQTIAEVGARVEDLPNGLQQELRRNVFDALKTGKKIDIAAALRKADFDALNMPYTQGQITRDATQFARERNLRGVAGVGEPLQQRFDLQNQKLQGTIRDLAGNPSEPYQAGRTIIGALERQDARLKAGVDQAYDVARDHLGRAAPMDAAGFSAAANKALDDGMLGHYLPSEVRGILNDVSAGKIPFNVNTAVQIDSVLSRAQRTAGNGTPQSLAIGKVRDALNSASIADNVGTDAKAAFDAARGLASQRFKLQDAIPALKAAADGEAPDAFVQRFIIGGKVEETHRLAQMLQQTNPAAFAEARSQLGAKIGRAAFGQNLTGDKLAAPERLAAELRKIGTDKLKAFYSDAEIQQLQRAARVSAYINSTPSSAPVNYSNNIGAMLQILNRIPGMPTTLSLANAIRNTAANARDVRAAVNPTVPQTNAQLPPEAYKRLAAALNAASVAGGVVSAPR